MAEELNSQIMQGRDPATSLTSAPLYDESGIPTKVKKALEGARSKCEAQKKECRKADDYLHSNQWDAQDLMRNDALKRPSLTFNEIARVIHAVSGLERLNRRDIRFVTRALDSTFDDDEAGDLATASLATALELSHGEYERSRAIRDLATGGLGFCEWIVDYTTDLDGRVGLNYVDWEEMFWDTDARKDNMEDRRWIARERKIPRAVFKERWPDALVKVDQMAVLGPTGSAPEEYRLVTPYYSLENEAANPPIAPKIGTTKDIVVVQYQWMEMEPVYRYLDDQNPDGDLVTMREREWKRLASRLKKLGRQVPPHVVQSQPVYKQAYVSNGILLEEEVELPGGFTLMPMTGIWDRKKKVWYGLVRAMIDPQNVVNKSLSSALTFLISNAKGGTLFESNAFVDPDKARQDWTKPDAMIEVGEGMIEKVKPRQSPQMPAEIPMFHGLAKEAIAGTSGINDEVLGFAQGETPSPTSQKRIQAGLTVLGWFFDAISRYQHTEARVGLEMVREYWAHGQLIQVGGEISTHAAKLMKENLPNAMDYQLTLDESMRHNPNIKAQVWQDLQPILPSLLRYGFGRFVLYALKFSPWPAQLVQLLQKEAAFGPGPQKPGGKGGKQESPEAQQAKIEKTKAETEKILAEADQIRGQGGLDTANLIIDAIGQANEQKHRAKLEQHRHVSDVLKSIRMSKMTHAKVGNFNGGE